MEKEKTLSEQSEQLENLEAQGIIKTIEHKILPIDETEGIYQENCPLDLPQIGELENRAKFLERLKDLPEEEIQLIDFCYDIAKEAHRPQVRKDGVRYFEHVRQVAIILMDECKIMNPDMIKAALLHDSIEDSSIFGKTNQSYTEWSKVSAFRLTRLFNEKVAKLVINLTKPSINNVEFKTKDEMHHFYIDRLQNGPDEVKLVKMCDRLHNLRSLTHTKPEFINKQLKETREVYLPIFESAKAGYPEQASYMIDEMNKAMAIAEQVVV